jgi:hypothetical protein
MTASIDILTAEANSNLIFVRCIVLRIAGRRGKECGAVGTVSAALFRFSKAGRQAVVTTKFEFRRFTPQKKIPII